MENGSRDVLGSAASCCETRQGRESDEEGTPSGLDDRRVARFVNGPTVGRLP
jgi:hypothetical protein